MTVARSDVPARCIDAVSKTRHPIREGHVFEVDDDADSVTASAIV